MNPVNGDVFSFYTPESLRRKNLWLINLRWIATVTTIALILIGSVVIPGQLPFLKLILVLMLLVGFNLIYGWFAEKYPPTLLQGELTFVRIQMYVDLVLLTLLIHLTGGASNPFYLFYIFHVIIACTIFEEKNEAYGITIIAVVLFSLMTLLEYLGWVDYYSIFHSTLEPFQVAIALGVFYVTLFASSYLGVTLMARHKKVKNLLYEQNQILEETAQSKLKFFRFVSHELKSPIVAIQSAINVVLDVLKPDIETKSLDMLTRARNRASGMLDILKDLLDVSYDRGKDGEDVEKVVPCDYLKEFIENEKPLAKEKDVEIVEDICAERGTLRIDKFILEKIYSNLLSNAIRYTPKGGRVSLSTELTGSHWSFKVADTGIGITPLDQKHIFDEFYRAKNAKECEPTGTGLGMNIVKNLVEQLQGAIELKSELNQGTTITVRIPLP